jgi:hypothetical protein
MAPQAHRLALDDDEPEPLCGLLEEEAARLRRSGIAAAVPVRRVVRGERRERRERRSNACARAPAFSARICCWIESCVSARDMDSRIAAAGARARNGPAGMPSSSSLAACAERRKWPRTAVSTMPSSTSGAVTGAISAKPMGAMPTCTLFSNHITELHCPEIPARSVEFHPNSVTKWRQNGANHEVFAEYAGPSAGGPK